MGTAQLVFVEDPCGGSRGSDHCACLTGSDVTGSHVTFSLTFPPYFPVLFFPYFFPVFFFPTFFPYFFLSSSTQMLVGVFSTTSASYIHRKLPPPLLFSYIRCSLRRPRHMNIGHSPFFHILGVLYDVRVL